MTNTTEKSPRRGFSFPVGLGHAGVNVQCVWLDGKATLDSIAYQRLHSCGRRRGQNSFVRSPSSQAEQCCGGTLAQTQTLAAKPDSASAEASGTRGAKQTFQFCTKFVRTTCDTRDVITDTGHDRRTGLKRKHLIE